jgi:hypothetical protein
MLQVLVMLVVAWLWILPPPLWAQGSEEEPNWLQEIFAKNRPSPVAGMPYEDAMAILKRHNQKLINLPGVEGVGLSADGILVYTNNPSVVPSQVEGLPVNTTPPQAPVHLPPTRPQEAETEPPIPDCGPYAHWRPDVGRCQRDSTLPPESLIPSTPRMPLPPPAEVLILRPDGTREKAAACPEGLKEETEQGWRFCVPPDYTGSLPPLWEPPIAGIPYEEALVILERHQKALMQLPGVTGVGLSAWGILVLTDTPAVVPSEVEGLPIITRPSRPARVGSHSRDTRIRPLRGAAAVRDQLWTGRATLTGTVLSQGRPWLIFPTHLMRNCHTHSGCPPGTTPDLNNCSPYAGIRRIVQPTDGSSELVGFVQRWDRIAAGTTLPNTDVAAAFMDNDAILGNGSLHAERRIEGWGGFIGSDGPPAFGTEVTLVSSVYGTPPSHTLKLVVVGINMERNVALHPGDCHDPDSMTTSNTFARFVNQTVYETPSGELCPLFGDSGSPILDAAGRIIGMLNWIGTGTICESGGTNASTIKAVLGFNNWYGTQTSGFALRCN